MKVVILAGGQQSTISSDREGIPKPMVEIGGRPLLWHIMKHFAEYGLTEFIVCGGYRVDMIKDYFMDYYIYESDITVDLQSNTIEIHKKRTEDWKVTVVNTGLNATPGQRILAIEKYLPEEDFVVTYGDCLSDVDMYALQSEHKRQGQSVTLVMAKPTGRKQLLSIDESGRVRYDRMTPVVADAAWVNADCFILKKSVLQRLQGNCDLERQIFKPMAQEGHVATYKHEGFWTTVETRRDLLETERMWAEGTAPWITQGH